MKTNIKRLKGEHCRDCKVFCADIDRPSIEMIQELLDNKHSAGNKPTQEILNAVSPTCRILYILKSKINLKASNNGNL